MNWQSLVLVGCAISVFTGANVRLAEAQEKGAPTVVRLWHGLGGGGNAIQAHAERFNALHPEIRVDVEKHGGYADTLREFRAAITNGDPPDIAVIEVHSITSLAAGRQIAPIDGLLGGDKKFAVDDLQPATLLNLRWKDQLYGVPLVRSTPVLYFNKRRFKDAGLDPEKPPRTWTELREMARKLTTDPERSYGFGAMANAWHFEALVFGAGGELLSKDGTKAEFAAAGAKPLQRWADMIHKDKTARLADRGAFVRGEAAMFIESTALLSSFEAAIKDSEIGTTFVPYEEGKKPGVPTGGGVAVMPAKLSAEKQLAAWKFLASFVATEQTAEVSRRTGYIPVRKSAVALLTKEGFYEQRPNYRTAVEQLKFAREMPVVPSWPQAMSAITKALQECLEKNEPADVSLTRAAQEVERILARNSPIKPAVPKPQP
jgi:sn-glycerol 3-phosphate transport system substrate-binding protein